MAEKQTVKSRFQSTYGARFISASQWLAEFMCARKSFKEKKELPPHFWEDKEWCKFFKFQVVIAARLLKKYHPLAIAEAARLNKGCYSLNAPFLLKSIETCQLKYKNRILEYEQQSYDYGVIVEQREVIVEKPKEQFVPKNIKSLKSVLDDT